MRYNPLMNSLLTALVLGLAATSSFADEATAKPCDCKKIAGLWQHIDTERHVGTFVNIPKSCIGVQMQQIPEQKEDQGLTTDRVLCEGGKFRMQYRFPEGYVDDEGTKAEYPMKPEVAAQLQGDIRVGPGRTIRFGMDLFDDLCRARDGKPCDSAKFKRVPKKYILEE